MSTKLQRYKLSSLIDVKRGQSISGEYYASEGEHIRLTLANFDYVNGGFKEDTQKDDLFYTGPVKPECLLKKGDIITPLTEQALGLLGSTARIPASDKYVQSGDIALVTCKDGLIDPNFCYYLLPSKQVKKQLAAGSQQTKIRHTSPDAIKACVVDIPDYEQQKKIGKFLSLLDRKISLNRAINKNLEALAKQIYDYWFVQFDFPDENGRPYKSSGGKMVWNEKLKREIPMNWSNCDLNTYIGRITNGLNPRKNFVLGTGKNYYITIRSLLGTDIDWKNCDRCDDLALQKINSRSQLKVGDVIFSAIGTIGRTYFIQEEPSNWNISETSFTLRAKEGVNSYFFYALLRSEEIQLRADKQAMGSTLRCLVMDSLCKIPTIKVEPVIIEKFGKIVKPLYQQIYQINKEIRNLMNLKDDLLPLLMNGQVTIK